MTLICDSFEGERKLDRIRCLNRKSRTKTVIKKREKK